MKPGDSAQRPAWEAELHLRIIRVIVTHGSPVEEPSDWTYYGWHARDWEALGQHLMRCEPDFPRCSWADDEWTEFAGTFADDHHRAGLQALVWCRCGVISGRKWRFSESYADLLRSLSA